MDIDTWLVFYRKWERDRLINEVSSCHKYERKLLLDAYKRAIGFELAYNLMVQNQTRQNIIMQVIEEKAKMNSALIQYASNEILEIELSAARELLEKLNKEFTNIISGKSRATPMELAALTNRLGEIEAYYVQIMNVLSERKKSKEEGHGNALDNPPVVP